jgi:hypothetical protein
MCLHFPDTFSRGTVQKFRGTLLCRGTPFENPWSTRFGPAGCRLIRTLRTNFHIYSLLPLGVGLLGSPKDVEI